ncbi:MAG: hypothetical protein AB7D51_09320 [Desulfovibrionaceae bacterium]
MPVYNWVGFLFMGAGAIFLLYGLFLLSKKRTAKSLHVNHICPVCESVLLLGSHEEHTCPHDGSPLEPLKGYYDRHPERRDQEVTPNGRPRG